MKLFHTTVEGIPALISGQRQICKTCALTKSAKIINRDAPERVMRPPQRVYRLRGPIRRSHASGESRACRASPAKQDIRSI
jgi:hypothetical protein